jgi:hypothetical protein
VSGLIKDLIEHYRPSGWFSRFWLNLPYVPSAEENRPVPRPSGFSRQQGQHCPVVGLSKEVPGISYNSSVTVNLRCPKTV